MCGLVGIAGALELRDEATMKRLFLLDYFRGPDSTGFAAIRNSGDVSLAKVPSHPLDLFDMGRFKVALSGHSSKAFLGHNRAATRGVVNHANAHPYEVDHIVGMHNGTLDYSSEQDLEKAIGEKVSTDSLAIFTGIAKMGVEETIPHLKGAWSLVWYDGIEKTLNFLRNKERPMWYAYTSDFKRMFWASEWAFIDAAVRMAPTNGGYELYKDPDTGFMFWPTEENIHYKYSLEDLKAGGKERPKPKAKLLKGKEPAPVTTGTAGGDPFGRGSNGVWIREASNVVTMTPSTTTSRTGVKKDTGPKQVIHLLGDPENPFAGYFDRDKFDALAKYGCSFCQKDIEWGDNGIIVFERDDYILCNDCATRDPDDASDATRIVVKNIDNFL